MAPGRRPEPSVQSATLRMNPRHPAAIRNEKGQPRVVGLRELVEGRRCERGSVQ